MIKLNKVQRQSRIIDSVFFLICVWHVPDMYISSFVDILEMCV